MERDATAEANLLTVQTKLQVELEIYVKTRH